MNWRTLNICTRWLPFGRSGCRGLRVSLSMSAGLHLTSLRLTLPRGIGIRDALALGILAGAHLGRTPLRRAPGVLVSLPLGSCRGFRVGNTPALGILAGALLGCALFHRNPGFVVGLPPGRFRSETLALGILADALLGCALLRRDPGFLISPSLGRLHRLSLRLNSSALRRMLQHVPGPRRHKKKSSDND